MIDVIEVDAVTGAVLERDFTPEEIAQREADAQAAVDAAAAAEAKAAEVAAARAAVLERLGLSEDEVVVLLGGVS